MKKLVVFLAIIGLLAFANLYDPIPADSAATAVWTQLTFYQPEDIKYRCAVTFDASYAPYGETISATSKFSKINYAIIESTGDSGYHIVINDSLFSTGSFKLQIYQVIAAAAADTTALTELASGTDASGITGVTVIVSGKK